MTATYIPLVKLVTVGLLPLFRKSCDVVFGPVKGAELVFLYYKCSANYWSSKLVLLVSSHFFDA